MKKRDVQIGGEYRAKVSGTRTVVRILRECPYGGWDAVNTATGRDVRIRTAARLQPKVDASRFVWNNGDVEIERQQ